MYEILQAAEEGDTASRVFDLFIMALIALNVLAVVLQTIPSVPAALDRFFRIFEIVSVAIFTCEYALRVWSCTEADGFAHPVSGRIRFALTPMALVDLIAILPFYTGLLGIAAGVDLRFMRALRLLRLLRVLKLGRYSESLKTMGEVIRAKREELAITGFILMLLVVLASSLMYLVENPAQPDKFCSIPAAMWWATAALTTVGYGDVYPVTALGKLLGTVISVLGIGLFALPAGILASGFAEQIARRRKGRRICPHCGQPVD